jgi:DNA-binding MarR family transcriptional regulator
MAASPATNDADHEFLVLHGLKLKGFAEPPAIAAVAGVDEAAVVTALAALAEAEMVKRRDGRISGWSLTPDGRTKHADLLSAHAKATGEHDNMHAQYTEFLVLNAELLAVCTAWQVRDLANNELNDHLDPDYDAEVIDRLKGIHEGVTPICHDLSGRVARFTPYHPRFVTALDKVDQGLTEWFAKPIIDSYHTVWMELHEDLLATLAIDRSSEPQH